MPTDAAGYLKTVRSSVAKFTPRRGSNVDSANGTQRSSPIDPSSGPNLDSEIEPKKGKKEFHGDVTTFLPLRRGVAGASRRSMATRNYLAKRSKRQANLCLERLQRRVVLGRD
jgi:hypothetical protein